MARALAFTQFLIVSLGVLTLHLLVKLDSGNVAPGPMASLAQFLARYMLWLFVVPILYAAVGNTVLRKDNEREVGAAGIALCVILVALLGFPIVFHLS